MLNNFWKALFGKKDTINHDDGVSRVQVDRAPIQRAKVLRNKDGKHLTKLCYTDTNEIVVLDMWDKKVFEEVMTNGRPVKVLGFATEEDLA